MDIFGEIELTVVREHNALTNVPFPAPLVNGSMVDIASVTLDLSSNPDGVLLMGTVNWSATFAFDTNTIVLRNGFANVTFQLLRDGNVIYQVTQTIRQKDLDNTSTTPVVLTTFEIAKLLYIDGLPLSGTSGLTTYTLRATNINLLTPLFAHNGSGADPTVTAAVGPVTLVAQEVEGCHRHYPPFFKGVERVFVDETVAPLPVDQLFPIPLQNGSTMDLATIDVGLGCNRNGILLLAVVNWSFRVDSGTTPVDILASLLANVTFELLRNGVVIYRTTQTAVQSALNVGPGPSPVDATTFEIADVLHFDIPSPAIAPGINTYTLRATNVTVVEPLDSVILTTAVEVGSVTLVAEEIEASKKKRQEV